jgi:hypothetical protein
VNLADKIVVTLHYSISLRDYRKTLRVYAAEQISGRARLVINSPSCQMFLPQTGRVETKFHLSKSGRLIFVM